MTIEEIRELLGLFNESGVAEMEVQRGENRVRLKRAVLSPTLSHEYVVAAPAPASGAIYAAAPQAAGVPAPATPSSLTGASAVIDAHAEKNDLIKSPIVGTFYESASPGAAPFVKVGDQIEKGQVLCIIESMKLMNEIEAEFAGTIVSRLVDNGKPVEYGQALFAVKPR